MTQEEKQLMLITLCDMLPYGVVCKISYTFNNETTNWEDVESTCDDIITKINFDTKEVFSDWLSEYSSIDDVKPYLRPMSSMTEEDLRDFAKIKYKNNALWEIVEFPNMGCYKGFINVRCMNKNKGDTWIFQVNTRTPLETYYGIDWLNEHHFDYRGLIEKGLALEASKDMYKTE